MRRNGHAIRQKREAFTLLELLVAVSIFAVVLAAINSVFFSALRLRNRTAEALDRSLPVEHALWVMRRDLQNILPPGGTLFGSLQTQQSTNSIAGATTPTFFTSTGLVDDTSPFSEVQKVSYSLLDATNRLRGRDLVRLVSRNLLAATPETPVAERLLEGVEAITFQFYDGSQWREYWDSTTEATKLPRGIKVQIQLAQDTLEPRREAAPTPVELVVAMPGYGGTNSATQTASTTE
jgi:general secretion pathway protein J